MSREWTEMEIAAFTDGELDAPDAARIAAIIAEDPEARAFADRLAGTNALLRQAFNAPMDEPAPAALAAAILGTPIADTASAVSGATAAAKVTALPAARRPRLWMPAAIAAGVALVIGFTAGRGSVDPVRPDRPALPAVVAVGPAAAAVAAALETAPSGTGQGGVRPIASFDVAGGGICREFESVEDGGVATSAGVACRQTNGAWSVLLVAAIDGGDRPAGGGYAPAAGLAGDSLSHILNVLGAGPALSPAAEAARIDAAWR